MLTIYRLIWWLASPLVRYRLQRKAQQQSAYGQRIAERQGVIDPIAEPVIWFHTVSVGESLAAIAMIKAIAKAFPERAILVTTMTPTGSQVVQTKLAGLVHHCYLPWDRQRYVATFLSAIAPQVLVLMETEIWPELITQVHAKGVPIVLANARLSARSARGYRRFRRFSNHIFKQLTLVCAQSEADAERFRQLGAEQVMTVGTVKFDITLTDDARLLARQWRQAIGKRFVWLAASTHPGEEALVLKAHQALLACQPDALLILAPRHPDRCQQVAALVSEQGLTQLRRTQGVVRAEQVWQLDSLGELVAAMGASDLVFIGGSLVPHGGHNPLEAGVWPKPVLTGPHYFNFHDVVSKLRAQQAIEIVDDVEALSERVVKLAADSNQRRQLAEQLAAVLQANRGSTDRQVAQVCRLVERR